MVEMRGSRGLLLRRTRDPNDVVFDLFHTHECEWVNGSLISTPLHTSDPILNETL